MGALIGIVVLGGIVFAGVRYTMWLNRGIRPRVLQSDLSETALRELFSAKVATHGWHIAESGNPVVAQSSLLAGIRQQIGLRFMPEEGGRRVIEIAPHRVVRTMYGIGAPTKAHTLRMRMNAFVHAVGAVDPQLVVRS